jgi:hypothetical protein
VRRDFYICSHAAQHDVACNEQPSENLRGTGAVFQLQLKIRDNLRLLTSRAYYIETYEVLLKMHAFLTDLLKSSCDAMVKSTFAAFPMMTRHNRTHRHVVRTGLVKRLRAIRSTKMSRKMRRIKSQRNAFPTTGENNFVLQPQNVRALTRS